MEILYIDEDGWIGRYKEPTTGFWFLSVEINSWKLSSYKKYISIFAIILNNFSGKYYSLVKGDKEKKFNMLFGFKETGVFVITKEGIREILYVI